MERDAKVTKEEREAIFKDICKVMEKYPNALLVLGIGNEDGQATTLIAPQDCWPGAAVVLEVAENVMRTATGICQQVNREECQKALSHRKALAVAEEERLKVTRH